jgi:hypothetical protein
LIFVANFLIESIDESVDPCQNFYEFTCGTWIKNEKMKEDGEIDFLFIENNFLFCRDLSRNIEKNGK